jgi:large subunit ribosomal protein L13
MKALMKTTKPAKPAEVEKKWHLIDADGLVVGRLATIIANILRGKHKPSYTPHVDMGDHVVVINADKVAMTGRKMRDKEYHRHTGHPGGIKTTTPAKILASKFPERVVELAVKRMMPGESPLARKQFAKLRVYAGTEHPHAAQNPEVVDFKSKNSKNVKVA